MAEPLKEMFNRDAVKRLADLLVRGASATDVTFNRRTFVRRCNRGLDALELKARVQHLSDSLHHHLPDDYPTALALLLASLGPASTDDKEITQGFVYWPLCDYVERFGTGHPEASLDAMHTLTQRFSCEFAIRPYLERTPEIVYPRLAQWALDPSLHVRRLVSEGTRPRLPWGGRLHALVADPSPNLPLLQTLHSDPEEYVRRSVANHLNDIAKDHPTLVVRTVKPWARDPDNNQQRLVRHALRTLVKAGHTGALRVLGFGTPKLDHVGLELHPKTLLLRESLSIRVTLASAKKQDLLIDYAVHHRRASGVLSPKVFKWTQRSLKKGEQLTLRRKHAIRPISTRRYYPGLQRVELLVNGTSVATADFRLKVD